MGKVFNMSVFTPVTRPELETFLAPYGLGRLLDFQGIAAGTENSNFFVSLEKGEFVLTLIERGPAEDMPFFVDLLDVLHQGGMPVPYALRDDQGRGLRELCGKPALLQPRLLGKHVLAPNNQHCAQVGELLAHIHLATRDNILERRTDRGLDWMVQAGAELLPTLSAEQAALLQPVLNDIQTHRSRLLALPQANLHADLFRDNVMFEGTHLTGLIDFYNACSGPMLYDLAITVNDWCLDDAAGMDKAHAQALLGAYAALRPFTAAEAELWPVMLRIACVRFWLSRLIAAREFVGRDVTIHDPTEFERRLAQRGHTTVNLPFAL